MVPHTAPEEVTAILRRAETAAAAIARTAPAERLGWLKAVAGRITAELDALVGLAREETGLGLDRLRGEVAKAAASAVFYGEVAAEGSYLAASRDVSDAQTSLARWNVPVGPVAVFGASNFPFGFGVIGHDVASALAAGCPVIAKAHPSHPRLSARLAALVRAALAGAGAPEGAYGLVVGFEAGLQLVDAPAVKAVAFTGSQGGGMALVERAACRGVPVFAEMGTVNPVFVTAQAAARAQEIAAGFVESFTLGAGQFCTKPGLLFAPAGAGIFAAVKSALAPVAPGPLLNAAIARNYGVGVGELAAAAGVEGDAATAAPDETAGGFTVDPAVIPVRLQDLQPGSRLLAECFGPVALVCEYEDFAAALAALAVLQPALAAAVFTGPGKDPEAEQVIGQLLPQVGRITLNDWPTGVTTSWSQQHGGPWPATSRPEATSVGAGALRRFVRPVALQNAGPHLLPPALQPDNPWQIPRRINGTLILPHP